MRKYVLCNATFLIFCPLSLSVMNFSSINFLTIMGTNYVHCFYTYQSSIYGVERQSYVKCIFMVFMGTSFKNDTCRVAHNKCQKDAQHYFAKCVSKIKHS